ncbi:hypothetical protein ADT71_19125 [Novosphingobium sp. ST904]|nr:hypothetical protein ADT71_19125 [Novosphingobium sp. ST904]
MRIATFPRVCLKPRSRGARTRSRNRRMTLRHRSRSVLRRDGEPCRWGCESRGATQNRSRENRDGRAPCDLSAG